MEKPPKTISLRTAAQFRWNRETKKKKNPPESESRRKTNRGKEKKKKKQRVAEFVDPRAGGIRVPRGFLIARGAQESAGDRRFPRQGEEKRECGGEVGDWRFWGGWDFQCG